MNRINRFIINVIYTFFANGFSLFISMIVMLLLPRFLNISGYGYWQLYVLYTGYLGLFHLGLCDGVYLKFGGKQYSDLDKNKYSQQFKLLSIYILVLVGIAVVVLNIAVSDIDKKEVLIFTVIALLLYTPKNFLLLTIQAVGDFREYSRATICERTVFFVCTIFLLLQREENYRYYILADILARAAVLIYVIFIFRNVIKSKIKISMVGVKECIDNIRSGYPIVVAGIASNLIVGIVRFCIEDVWNIEVFSKVSLALSILNIVLSFMNMVSLVLFPFLKTMTSSSLIKIFRWVDEFSVLGLLGLLIAGSPISLFIQFWLPDYRDSIIYFCILLPSCMMECKMAIICNSYFKTLEEQKKLLYINLLTLLISGVFSFVFIYWLKNLLMSVYLIAFLLIFRTIISEITIRNILNIQTNFIGFCELIFIGLYFVVLIILDIHKASIFSAILFILMILKNKNHYILLLKYFKIIK